MEWDTIIEFIQRNGYKDFMTYFLIVSIVGSFVIYLIIYIKDELAKDPEEY